MPTATFAVQPSAFGSFDEWGCLWATDFDHALRLAHLFASRDAGPQTIWRVADRGTDHTAWMEIR